MDAPVCVKVATRAVTSVAIGTVMVMFVPLITPVAAGLVKLNAEIFLGAIEGERGRIRGAVERLPDTYEGEESAVFRTTKSEVLSLLSPENKEI